MMRNLLVATLLVFSPSLFAAEVVKVKGKGVLIELRGDPAMAGDDFYLIAPDGKRKAIVKISKVKGDKAIGKLLKGKAAPGHTLEFKTKKAAGAKPAGPKMAAPSMDDGSATATRSYWGALFGFAKDSMDVQVTSATNQDLGTVSMTGYGFSAKGLFDYELFSQIWFRGTAGLETFNASAGTRGGGRDCGPGNSDACNAKLMYLTFDFIGRYVFSTGNFRPWAGIGMGLLFPASKEASALDPASISTTNVIIPCAGFDWFTSPTFYIPVSIEYGMLPKSDEVEASWIAVRGGFAVPF